MVKKAAKKSGVCWVNKPVGYEPEKFQNVRWWSFDKLAMREGMILHLNTPSPNYYTIMEIGNRQLWTVEKHLIREIGI